MNNQLQDKVKDLASNYKVDEALEIFLKIKELLSFDVNINSKSDFIPLASYFDYEPEISYYLFKESYKIMAEDIFKDIVESGYNQAIVRISSNVFGSLAFKQEELFLSKAAKDAFEDSFKDYFKEFESIALEQNKKTMLEMKLKTREIMLDVELKTRESNLVKFFNMQSENSVYKERLQENIKSVFEQY